MAPLLASGWKFQQSTNSNSTAIILKLSEDKIKELKTATKLQLVTGKNTSIHYGNQSLDLVLTPERYDNELYHQTIDLLTHYTNVSARAQIAEPKTDDALIALQQSLANIRDQKKASSTQVAKAVLPDPKSRFAAARQSKQTVFEINKQLGSSPMHTPAPTHHDSGASKTKAMRLAVIHLLAIRPLSTDDIAATVRIPTQVLKGVLQTLASNNDGLWTLSDRAHKELDVWKFKYPSQKDRQAAIDHAVRAYDRQRLSRGDNLWQMLLPKAERGQGKVLSRLHYGPGGKITSPGKTTGSDSLASSQVNSPHPQGTPKPVKKNKDSVIDRLLSKDPAKARAQAEAKEKKRKDREDEVEERAAKRQATKKTIKSAARVLSSDDEDHNDNKTSTKFVKSQAKHVNAEAPRKDIKTTSAAKLTPHLNGTAKAKAHISPPKALRPTVPSPLGATRPRVASDVSDRSGISHRRNGLDTPQTLGVTPTPRKRHDTVTSTEAEPAKLRKPAMDSQSGLSQKSKLSSTTDNKSSPLSSSQAASQDRFDGGSSDSSMSVIDTITFSQGVDLAIKFQDEYYPQYAKLYDSIDKRQHDGEVVSTEEVKQLWDMHKRLQQMKNEIKAASERQQVGNES